MYVITKEKLHEFIKSVDHSRLLAGYHFNEESLMRLCAAVAEDINKSSGAKENVLVVHQNNSCVLHEGEVPDNMMVIGEIKQNPTQLREKFIAWTVPITQLPPAGTSLYIKIKRGN